MLSEALTADEGGRVCRSGGGEQHGGEGACEGASAVSTPGSGASASSRVATRIASLQEKFAAAEQLLQGSLAEPAMAA